MAVTPNLSIPLDQAGVTPGSPGFNWALDLETFKTIMDAHNHTGGPNFGLQITSAAININADLGWAGNNLINLRSLRLANQGSPLAGANDLGCVYESGGNLYYNNSTGQQVQITSGSSLVASGAIGGMGGTTAQVNYSNASKTFIFTQATNQSASLDAGQLILRDPATVSSTGITLKAPAGGPGSSYSLTWPSALPGTSDLYWVNSSGTISTGAFTSTAGGTFNGNLTIAGTNVFQTGTTSFNNGLLLPSTAVASITTPASTTLALYQDSVTGCVHFKTSAPVTLPIYMSSCNTVTIASFSTVETVIAGGKTGAGGSPSRGFQIPANGLQLGSTIRIKIQGQCTSSVANLVTFNLRVGSNGTTADTNLGAIAGPTAATSGTSIPWTLIADFPIGTIGASAKMLSTPVVLLINGGTTGINTVQLDSSHVNGASGTFNSTVANFFEVSALTAAATTTLFILNATMELIPG